MQCSHSVFKRAAAPALPSIHPNIRLHLRSSRVTHNQHSLPSPGFYSSVLPRQNSIVDHHDRHANECLNGSSPTTPSAPPSPGPTQQQRLLSTLAAACARAACVAAVLAIAQHLLPSSASALASAAPASSNPIAGLLDFVLHLDHHMSGLIETHGQWTLAILWAIVFCETGLVLTPFLPGDSLLFAAGAFAGMGKLCVWKLLAVFLSSAILGDAVNYLVGSKLGALALSKNIIKQEYIAKTEAFYDKYGGKTVVLARFVPIVRTFAPFVAGVGSMPYARFALYNVLGAALWTFLFLGAGFFFGNLPFVQKNFTLVVLAIVAVSVVPIGIEVLNARREEQQKQGGKERPT